MALKKAAKKKAAAKQQNDGGSKAEAKSSKVEPEPRKVEAEPSKVEAEPSKAEAEPSKKSTKASSSNKRKKADVPTKAAKRGKRAKTDPKPKPEPEYLPERRNMDDLWKSAFPVGTEWDNMDKLSEIKWDFSNLEEAFEEGGLLYEKKVYMFGSTEPQYLPALGSVILIPVVVAVESPFPPSDKLGINSVQRETEEIVPMKQMKMDWIPYVPLENRHRTLEGLKTQIYTLSCTQRRSALKHLKIERVKKYDYCIPYFEPLTEQEDEVDTVINILYPSEPPLVCDFDWDLDDVEDFTDELIQKEALSNDQKEKFMEFVKEQVRARKREQRQAKEARKKMLEDMDPVKKAAFENMKFYKFYPVKSENTPDISQLKAEFINRYYGKAHKVL